MSANNIDVDMQHPEFQQEDIQTSHDADLFGDDEDDEDDDKGPGNFMDVLSQPPTSISGKHHIQEVDYSQVLRQTVYEQQEHISNIIEETEVICREAQDHIEEQQCLAEEEHEHHMHDFNKRWEKALREQEQEKQEIHTWQEQQQALLRKNVAEELAWHKAKISAKKDQEHFARHGRQQHVATEISTDPTQRNAQQPPHMPQKPQLKTLCLKMTKKIRKARGTTRKMHLVSVVEDADEPMEIHQERSSTIEQEPQ
ncbi:uncharacterized protein BJ212DRAFT_1479535 [Suillus subaureus]|uniref:Uncharacterized protein n=1 Tax=Suillus subaureus TaxID=48587 RepID=A0A9P7EDF4_9AGAM|nr:uncharacterized protein BJ212DRAFT_1479535 [Suillus subaureus]KAG1818528.1 hypothetical protein BJ212DRAFT_1479535 [Suillus subaureus]